MSKVQSAKQLAVTVSFLFPPITQSPCLHLDVVLVATMSLIAAHNALACHGDDDDDDDEMKRRRPKLAS